MTLPESIDPQITALTLGVLAILVLLLLVAMTVFINRRLFRLHRGVYKAAVGIEKEMKVTAAQIERLNQNVEGLGQQLEVSTSALLGIEATVSEISKRQAKRQS